MHKKHSAVVTKMITSIKQAVLKGNKKLEENGLANFVDDFFKFAPASDFEKFNEEELSYTIVESFDFFLKKKIGQPKVRIFNPGKSKSHSESEYTIIELINDDKPFLVDSVTEAINKTNLKVHQLLYPLLNVSRDKAGNLIKVFPSGTSESKDVKVESFMHFKVSHISDKTLLAEFEANILRVLKAVEYAVSDWKQILSKLEYLIADISVNTEAFIRNSGQKDKLTHFRDEVEEIKEFMRWIRDNNFVILGYIEHDFTKTSKTNKLGIVKGSELGVFKLGDPEPKIVDPELDQKIHAGDKYFKLIEITKSDETSLVHRACQMDCIIIKKFNDKGDVIGIYRIFGLFTSSVYFQSAKQIPLLRKKIKFIEDNSGFQRSSHNGKALVAILEDLPRDELFQMDAQDLIDTATDIVLLSVTPHLRLFIRKDKLERFISCLIYLPRERMSTNLRQVMQTILTDAVNGEVVNHYTQISESHLARVQIIIRTEQGKIPKYNLQDLEKKLFDASRLWSDSLQDELIKRMGERTGEQVFDIYREAFNVSYQNRFSAEDGYYDTLQIEKVLKTNDIVFDLYESVHEAPEIFCLKIYSPNTKIPLTKIMPTLANMGVDIIDEHTYLAKPKNYNNDIWIHYFRFVNAVPVKPRLWDIKDKFETILVKIWNGGIQNTSINKLVLRAGLQWREVMLLRTYGKYLQQIRFAYSQEFIQEVLSLHPEAVKILIELFYKRFDPAQNKNRDKESEALADKLEKYLSKVSNLAEDKVIRGLLEVIESTIRTNFFQKDKDDNPKPVISIKINSSAISDIPLPRPFVEIFVYSPRVEAVHLRGGKVARGGLRWSDRREDFRTEVLGLMKAQMTKNSVIVPVGSKGGFVVKKPPVNGTREEFLAEGIECYKSFLRGLLDITDNIIGGKISKPKDVICYDDDDPYLVVAADKGTATFSDIANGISAEYNFWLGDAFASGGSDGYDHKKMGITAKGAWISVKRHFSEMALDVDKDDFTTIGVGDMSGDVFGNGMLLSKHIKLVAAFNHLHIFLDPNPDTAKSFAERQRLFNLPRSTWKDYNDSLISKGGGVYDRSLKTIKLSKEVKEALSINEDELSPDKLISAILKAPVDLFWNGGIGTYVKSKFESHSDAGDRANDVLRVNGEQLRAKVVGEGGNLGFTQLGRIEYAQNGGRINTDAIDNSAGVDCSDHEVNIKIALGKASESKKLNKAERDKLLEEMTDEVAALVLRDNYLQTQAITITQMHGSSLLELQARFIDMLEKEGRLDRQIEFLPSKEELVERQAKGRGLTRPELSVLLAYSKLSLYDQLLHSNLPDDPYFSSDLAIYFPQKLREKFKKEIESHPLRREIIATFITNSVVNRVGSTFFYHMIEETGMDACDVARAYTVARDVFGLREIWRDIEGYNGNLGVNTQFELFSEVQILIERTSLWFLRNLKQPLDVGKTFSEFSGEIKKLYEFFPAVLSTISRTIYDNRLEKYLNEGVAKPLAEKIAGLDAMSSACDIVNVTNKNDLPVNVVATIYFEIGTRLQLGWLRSNLGKLSSNSYWQSLSIKTMMAEIFDQQARITEDVVKLLCKQGACETSIDGWVAKNIDQISRFDQFIHDLKSQEKIDFSMMVVALRKVKEI